MIRNLSDIYEKSSTDGGHGLKFTTFTCAHCPKEYSLNDFKEACFLYGVFNLEGEKTGYVGTTCLNSSCNKNITLHGEKKLYHSLLKEIFFKDIIFDDFSIMLSYKKYFPEISLNDQAIDSNIISYCPDFNEILHCDCPKFYAAANDVDGIYAFRNKLADFTRTNKLPGEKYFSTSQARQILFDNRPFYIWWLTKEQIEHCISIENKDNVRLFPRSIHYDVFHGELESYLQDYGFMTFASENQKFINFFRKNPITKLEQIYFHIKPEKELLNKKIRFLDLLVVRPAPISTYNNKLSVGGNLKDFSRTATYFDNLYQGTGREIKHLDYPKIENKLIENIHNDNLQEILESSDIDFLKEYISLRKKLDFSFDKVWKLKDKYLYQIYTSCKNGFNIKKPKLRPSAIDKEKVQAVARKLWEQDPIITITAMSKKQEIIDACDNSYTQRTIRDWVKEVAPSHKPGRPKKEK